MSYKILRFTVEKLKKKEVMQSLGTCEDGEKQQQIIGLSKVLTSMLATGPYSSKTFLRNSSVTDLAR